MTASKKESLSSEELEQVSGGKSIFSEDGQSSLFMQDGTAHDRIGANAHVNLGVSVSVM